MKDNELILTLDDGTEEVCEILFTHEANGKNYVVFESLESGEASAAVYVPGKNEAEGEFFDIETDEEWAMIEELLQNFYEDLDDEDSDLLEDE